MYSELTARMFVGGWVYSTLYVDVLANAGVTHLMNLRREHVDPMVKKQFRVLECEKGEHDYLSAATFWMKVFDFTVGSQKGSISRLYCHVENHQLPESPVGCYAALRALGYTPIEARRKLLGIHPILFWHEKAIQGVESAFQYWVKTRKSDPVVVRHARLNKIAHVHSSRDFLTYSAISESAEVV